METKTLKERWNDKKIDIINIKCLFGDVWYGEQHINNDLKRIYFYDTNSKEGTYLAYIYKMYSGKYTICLVYKRNVLSEITGWWTNYKNMPFKSLENCIEEVKRRLINMISLEQRTQFIITKKKKVIQL